jgi:uncharacterized membrane protein YkvA (DUF1232 family)
MPLSQLKQHLQQLNEQAVYPFPHASQEKSLHGFIALLPDMLHDLQIWCDATQGETNLKRLYAHVLAYVFHGDDLLPEVDYGYWGYLDDVYLTGLAVAKTWGESPLTSRTQPDYLTKLQGWLSATQQLLPKESTVIQQVFGQMLLGQYALFDDVLMQDKVQDNVTA